MSMKTMEAYDAKAEWICRCSVRIGEGEPRAFLNGQELDGEGLEGLSPWEKTLLSLLKEDLYRTPMFDGEKIYVSRGHLTVSLPAQRAEETQEGSGVN